MTAADILKREGAKLRAGLGAGYDQLAREIGEFDFERAQATLHALASQSPGATTPKPLEFGLPEPCHSHRA
jgi:hypothetical protein